MAMERTFTRRLASRCRDWRRDSADAAKLLGAGNVYGCDIEHDSTLVARGNLDESFALFTGSARSVKTEAVDWAVCNLNAATLSTLAG